MEANSSSCLVEGRPLRSPGGAGEGREEETGHWVTKASTLEGTGQRQSPGVLEWVGRVVVLRLGEVFQVITGRNKSPRRLLKQQKIEDGHYWLYSSKVLYIYHTKKIIKWR